MLKISSLVRRYGKHTVLDAVDLQLSDGSLNVLGGANGTGKSTLLRLLAQLERPNSGRIEWEGKPPAPSEIGYLPQDLGFHPLLTVSRIIRFYAEVRDSSSSAAQAALVRWGLESHAEKRTSELSGGLRQRLGLAIMGLCPFKLLLLDEPDLSLDPEWRCALREWLARVAADGAVVMVTTHLAPEWESCADRILCCKDGKIEDQAAASTDASQGKTQLFAEGQR